MTDSLDNFRRDAKALHKAYDTMDADARRRVEMYVKPTKAPQHADFLHVIAREQTFASWPAMKDAIARLGLDRAARQQRLKIALYNGNMAVVRRLVADDPAVADGAFALQSALFDRAGVAAWLADDPSVATRVYGPRGTPLNHLAFSRVLQIWPDRRADMIAIAQMLVDAGADVNAAQTNVDDPGHVQTPLSGAIGFADNMVLGQWLLDHGANPTDREALYHACELDHADGVRMLCKAGADPRGTNALKRAMDFDRLDMVKLLLAAGADPNEGDEGWTALHHAALRLCGGDICRALIAAGADVTIIGKGVSTYAAAMVYGNADLAALLPVTPLSREEGLLAQAARGEVPDGVFINPNTIPDLYLDLVREFAGVPEKLGHIKALIKLGMPWDRSDGAGVPPVQIAGWLGQADMLDYFLRLKPDLAHTNGHGGTILSTILHGANNNPTRAQGDYIACARRVLEEGVALPENAIWVASVPELSAFLADWAERYPGQVVKHGFS